MAVDQPRARPPQIVAQAKAMQAAGEHAAAQALLLTHRTDWPRIPPFYDAALGRVCLALGHVNQAIAYLECARDGFGEAVPLQLRRSLGEALLRDGRIVAGGAEFAAVVAAGSTVTRPAFLAAIAAARFAADPANAGKENPHCVLSQAELLGEANDPAGAEALLVQSRPLFDVAPPAYEAALGRLALRAHDWEGAAVFLARARDSWPGAVPPDLRQQLGIALFHLRRLDEAGQELSWALNEGAALPHTDLRLAINHYRARTGDGALIDTGFDRNLTFVDQARRLVYLALPKNGCSLLKTFFVLNGPHREAYLATTQTIHEFCGRFTTIAAAVDAAANPDYFRFVVVRDPFRRILSAYLNKFVTGRQFNDPYTAAEVARVARATQAMLDIPLDPARSITFEEFVKYLAVTPDVSLNVHWMSQAALVGDTRRFDHIGRLERLDDTLAILSQRFGYALDDRGPPLQTRRLFNHTTRFSETAALTAPFCVLPDALEPFRGGMPVPELFYTPEMRELVRRRYAADFAIHAMP